MISRIKYKEPTTETKTSGHIFDTVKKMFLKKRLI
jgi:hypothetical protein